MSTHEDTFARARRVLPGGVSSPVRAFKSVGGTPRYARRGEGSVLIGEDGERWTEPTVVVTGYVGEPALVADGSLLYFVHVLVDARGPFGADIWYSRRRP